MWLDLSTRPREEEQDSKSSRLCAWFSSVALGRFVSHNSNEETVTFSLLPCSRKGAKAFADKLYGVTPKTILTSATEYGAAIDDCQFVSQPKVMPVEVKVQISREIHRKNHMHGVCMCSFLRKVL
jgi:hypothetical protein|mmetsp:Transcript_3266/g.11126  ORF Transcript_3266/g.11126 Transcript_3266/m.11126 type:complete len:125 (-) Transcript_3266:354-728(-)